MVQSLCRMISYNIGQLAYLNAKRWAGGRAGRGVGGAEHADCRLGTGGRQRSRRVEVRPAAVVLLVPVR